MTKRLAAFDAFIDDLRAIWARESDTQRRMELGRDRLEKLVRDPGKAPSQQMQQIELAAVVRRALENLNERQRAAVLLNKFEEMNYAEIAEVMQLSTKAVKSLLSRARCRLREALQDYVYMDGEPLPPAANGDEEIDETG